MTTRFMSRASAAFLLLVAAAASGQAQAQNYDGPGAFRFGAFVQASEYDFELETRGLPVGITFDSETFYGGGASIGYDWVPRQNLILGLEADASTEDSTVDYLLTFRGRVGAKLQPGWLVYATGGVAVLSVELYVEPNKNAKLAGVHVSDTSDTLTGWTVGGGTEFDLHQLTLFAEFLYVDFDAMDFKMHGVLGPGTVTPFSIDVDDQLARVGVKFKFGGDGERKGLK